MGTVQKRKGKAYLLKTLSGWLGKKGRTVTKRGEEAIAEQEKGEGRLSEKN